MFSSHSVFGIAVAMGGGGVPTSIHLTFTDKRNVNILKFFAPDFVSSAKELLIGSSQVWGFLTFFLSSKADTHLSS